MKWQGPFLGFFGMRYSYGVSASLRLNCWLQWPHLATKIHRRGLEFAEKARNIHRIQLLINSHSCRVHFCTLCLTGLKFQAFRAGNRARVAGRKVCMPWAVVILTASHKWEKIQFPVTNNRNILQSRWIKLVFWPAQIIGILWGRPTSLPRGPAGKLWSHEGMENAWNGCGFCDGTMQQWFDPISWRQQWGKRSASSE